MTESGAQLLARLEGRRCLKDIEPRLFPEDGGPDHGEVVELYGTEGTGKTELLYHLLCRCVLPRVAGGLEVDVVFVDTDYSLDMLRLVSILENRLNRAHSTSSPSAASDEAALRLCLSHLLVVHCSSSTQLLLTLHFLETSLSLRPGLALVLIDSISAFYWVDRAEGGGSVAKQEERLCKCTELLGRLLRDYRITVFATCHAIRRSTSEPSSTGGESDRSYLCRPWQQLVTHRLLCSRQEAPNSTVTAAGGNRFKLAGKLERKKRIASNQMPSEAQSQEPRDRGPPPPVTRAGRSAQLAKAAAATSSALERRPRGRPRKDGSSGRSAPPPAPPPPPPPPPSPPPPPKSRKKGRSRGRAQVEDEESMDATEKMPPQKTEEKVEKTTGRRRSTSRKKSNTNPDPDPEPSQNRLSPAPKLNPAPPSLNCPVEPAPSAEEEDQSILAAQLGSTSSPVEEPRVSHLPASPSHVHSHQPAPDEEEGRLRRTHSPAPMEVDCSPAPVAMETEGAEASPAASSPMGENLGLSPCSSPPVSPCPRLDDEDSLSSLFQRSLSEDSMGSPTPSLGHTKKRLKLCAFCYCGDDSPLGQGRLVVFGPTPGYIPLHILNRRASSDRDDDCHDHCYRGDQAPPMCGSPEQCDSSSEFVEQFGPIGLPHDINVQSLFDPTGQCCAHLQCAAWSEGVCRGEGQSLLYVDKAIDSGSTQVCVFCRQLGASLCCRESGCGRSYHFPCAAAAGAHQDWAQRHTWCTRHTQTASSQCALCLGGRDVSDILMCSGCGNCYHGSCLNPPLTPSPLCRAGWQCSQCRVCQSCRLRDDVGVLRVCERCDKAYHAHCLKPPLDQAPGTVWSCKNCKMCRRCGVRSSGQWANHPFLCESCDPALPCPLCDHVPDLYTPQEYLTCNCCYRCVHTECIVQAGEGRAGSESYICSTCRPQEEEKISISSIPQSSTLTPSPTQAPPISISQSPFTNPTKASPVSPTGHSPVQLVCSEPSKTLEGLCGKDSICTSLQQSPTECHPDHMELQQYPAPHHLDTMELQQSPSLYQPACTELQQSCPPCHLDPTEVQHSPAPCHPDPTELQQNPASTPPDSTELQQSPVSSPPHHTELRQSPVSSPPDPTVLQKSPAPSPVDPTELQQSPAPRHLDPTEFQQSPAPSPADPTELQQSPAPSPADPTELQQSPAPSPPDPTKFQQSSASSPPGPTELQQTAVPSPLVPTKFQQSSASSSPDPTDLQQTLVSSPPDPTELQQSSALFLPDPTVLKESPDPSECQVDPAPSVPDPIELQQSPAVLPPDPTELQQSSAPSFSDPPELQQSPAVSPPHPTELQQNAPPSPSDLIELQQSSTQSSSDTIELQRSPTQSLSYPKERQQSSAPSVRDQSDLQQSPASSPADPTEVHQSPALTHPDSVELQQSLASSLPDPTTLKHSPAQSPLSQPDPTKLKQSPIQSEIDQVDLHQSPTPYHSDPTEVQQSPLPSNHDLLDLNQNPTRIPPDVTEVQRLAPSQPDYTELQKSSFSTHVDPAELHQSPPPAPSEPKQVPKSPLSNQAELQQTPLPSHCGTAELETMPFLFNHDYIRLQKSLQSSYSSPAALQKSPASFNSNSTDNQESYPQSHHIFRELKKSPTQSYSKPTELQKRTTSPLSLSAELLQSPTHVTSTQAQHTPHPLSSSPLYSPIQNLTEGQLVATEHHQSPVQGILMACGPVHSPHSHPPNSPNEVELSPSGAQSCAAELPSPPLHSPAKNIITQCNRLPSPTNILFAQPQHSTTQTGQYSPLPHSHAQVYTSPPQSPTQDADATLDQKNPGCGTASDISTLEQDLSQIYCMSPKKARRHALRRPISAPCSPSSFTHKPTQCSLSQPASPVQAPSIKPVTEECIKTSATEMKSTENSFVQPNRNFDGHTLENSPVHRSTSEVATLSPSNHHPNQFVPVMSSTLNPNHSILMHVPAITTPESLIHISTSAEHSSLTFSPCAVEMEENLPAVTHIDQCSSESPSRCRETTESKTNPIHIQASSVSVSPTDASEMPSSPASSLQACASVMPVETSPLYDSTIAGDNTPTSQPPSPAVVKPRTEAQPDIHELASPLPSSVQSMSLSAVLTRPVHPKSCRDDEMEENVDHSSHLLKSEASPSYTSTHSSPVHTSSVQASLINTEGNSGCTLMDSHAQEKSSPSVYSFAELAQTQTSRSTTHPGQSSPPHVQPICSSQQTSPLPTPADLSPPHCRPTSTSLASSTVSHSLSNITSDRSSQTGPHSSSKTDVGIIHSPPRSSPAGQTSPIPIQKISSSVHAGPFLTDSPMLANTTCISPAHTVAFFSPHHRSPQASETYHSPQCSPENSLAPDTGTSSGLTIEESSPILGSSSLYLDMAASTAVESTAHLKTANLCTGLVNLSDSTKQTRPTPPGPLSNESSAFSPTRDNLSQDGKSSASPHRSANESQQSTALASPLDERTATLVDVTSTHASPHHAIFGHSSPTQDYTAMPSTSHTSETPASPPPSPLSGVRPPQTCSSDAPQHISVCSSSVASPVSGPVGSGYTQAILNPGPTSPMQPEASLTLSSAGPMRCEATPGANPVCPGLATPVQSENSPSLDPGSSDAGPRSYNNSSSQQNQQVRDSVKPLWISVCLRNKKKW
ncbi:hypothetical protein Q5P01_004376 [Channa striata]|uniref:Uncharacterized protein n=1 Tax=Channa striata TaxID=64152 RepID=A0AA88T5K8_CHASR|nr:hypothetical protein Q5P01_004376 [Channa striata]